MNGKKLLALVVAAIFIGGLAYITSNRSARQAVPSQVGRNVFPGLPVNDVQKVVIDNGRSSVALVRTESGWGVTNRFNYPVNFDKLRTALRALVDLKVHQVVRIDQAQKKALWLDAPGAAAGELAGTKVTLSGAGDKNIAEFILGKDHLKEGAESNPMFGGASYPDGRYIATADGTAYLVKETLEAYVATVRDWLDEQFFSAPPDDVRRIVITRPDKSTYSLVRAAAGNDLQLTGIATNEVTETTKASQITSTLGFMRFDDVAGSGLDAATTGLDKATELNIELGDGSRYAIHTGKTIPDQNLVYTKVDVSFQAPPEPVTTNTTILAETREKNRKRQEELQNLNARLNKWTYLVGSSTIDSIMPARDTLVKRMDAPVAQKVETPSMPDNFAPPMPMQTKP